MSSDRICSEALIIGMPAFSFSSGLRNFHSIRYRACKGGSSVDHVYVTSSPASCRTIGVSNGDASAVMEVLMPQTCGFSLAGSTRVALIRRVGTRMARAHQTPQRRSLELYW